MMLNPNIHLGEGNIKSTNTKDSFFLIWNLPAQQTCPYSTEGCRKRCFAMKNQRTFPEVRNRRLVHYQESLKPSFIEDMVNVIDFYMQSKKTANKQIFFRIHSSGDFYSAEYFNKWRAIAEQYRGEQKILFQCYTKSLPFIEHEWGDANIKIIFSLWGDTDPEIYKRALELGMPVFTAVPKNEIGNQGAFICQGDCGNCKECYTGQSKLIAIPYH